MFILMVVVFVLGYVAIALERPLKVDKAAAALIIGTLCWVIYMFGAEQILNLGYSPSWEVFLKNHVGNLVTTIHEFIVEHEIIYHLGDTSEILFFLLGAITIVEMIDRHDGFKIITDRIRTTNKIKLLWVVGFLTFFMSALLDNMTTTIVMVALLRKLIGDKNTRWIFASMVVIAANAGGAWSPIGDVTTIMLWIGGQITALKIILGVFLPSLANIVAPLLVLSFTMKGKTIERPVIKKNEKSMTTAFEQILMLVLGVCGLLFVPVFKTLTHLPPYMGMLLSLGVIWIVSELLHRNKSQEIKDQLRVSAILKRIDISTILFFLGILMAVAALQSAGQLNITSHFLKDKLGNVYLIALAIGVLSSVIDNVPLVAGSIGMYPVAGHGAEGFLSYFVQDGRFWEFLAYTAGTGGSILIIGSAAGVAAMGIEKIDFIWYLKKITLLAIVGYLAGAGIYYLGL